MVDLKGKIKDRGCIQCTSVPVSPLSCDPISGTSSLVIAHLDSFAGCIDDSEIIVAHDIDIVVNAIDQVLPTEGYINCIQSLIQEYEPIYGNILALLHERSQ